MPHPVSALSRGLLCDCCTVWPGWLLQSVMSPTGCPASAQQGTATHVHCLQGAAGITSRAGTCVAQRPMRAQFGSMHITAQLRAIECVHPLCRSTPKSWSERRNKCQRDALRGTTLSCSCACRKGAIRQCRERSHGSRLCRGGAGHRADRKCRVSVTSH